MMKITGLLIGFFLVMALAGSAWANDQNQLHTRMLSWEKQMQQFRSALFRRDYVTMERSMTVIGQSGALSTSMTQKLKLMFEEREFNDYMKLDRYIQNTALMVAKKARKGDIQKVVFHEGRLLIACIQCHDMFLDKAVQAMSQSGHR